MTVTEFFDTYNGDVESLNIRYFIPTAEKLDAIRDLVISLIDEDSQIIATYNQVAAMITKEILIMNLYMGLTCTTIEDYDRVIESGILNQIQLKGDDYHVCMKYFDLALEDAMKVRNSADGIAFRCVEGVKRFMRDISPDTLSVILEIIGGE